MLDVSYIVIATIYIYVLYSYTRPLMKVNNGIFASVRLNSLQEFPFFLYSRHEIIFSLSGFQFLSPPGYDLLKTSCSMLAVQFMQETRKEGNMCIEYIDQRFDISHKWNLRFTFL